MSTHLIPSQFDIVSNNSLDAYLNQIKRIPVLSAEAEQILAKEFFYHKNLEAARKLVMSNLRFVVYIAQGYANYGLAMNDLIQEGNIGLMKAVKRFNPDMKVRLISFAVHWIKAEIQEFILRNWRMVKMATTKAKRKLFFNLRKNKQHLGWSTHQEVKTVAKELGIKPETVREMEMHLSAQDMSLENYLDDTHSEDKTNQSRLPMMAFSDSRYDPESLVSTHDFSEWSTNALYKALESLDKRSREIIMQRWLNEPKVKLRTLAERYGLSMERIRQLERNAIKTLRTALEE
jgi:RNA polymerase sigma-32 factor